MSSEKYFIDTRYGFEIYSKATKKINNDTIGLVYNSDFNIVLMNNTSGNVAVNVYLDGVFVGNYEIDQHSIYKISEPLNPNQFFIFKPVFYNKTNNMHFSTIKLEWTPIITKYTYVSNPDRKRFSRLEEKESINYFPQKYFGQTSLEYDKRNNYSCKYNGHPEFIFDDELNLGISSDKYRIEKKYVNGSTYTQNLKMIILNPKYDIVNVHDYFVFNEKYLDIPEKQLLNKIM
jgi:hypothetical protein